MYEFNFPLQPIALKRHRHSFHHTWNPQSKELQHFKELFIEQATKYPDAFPITGPLELHLTLCFEMPKSWSKKKKAERENSFHTARPDLSNCIKFIEDALLEVAYHDDSQISIIKASKEWAYEPSIKLVLID